MRFMIIVGLASTCLVIGVPLAHQYAEDGRQPGDHQIQETQPGQAQLYAAGLVEGACREITLDFETRGRLQAILVAEGATVSRGDVLARLDSEMCEHALVEAKATLALAKAEKTMLVNGASKESREAVRAEVKIAEVRVAHTQRSLGRTVSLRHRGAVPEQELDDRTAAYELAHAELSASSARASQLTAAARSDELEIADAKIALAEAKVRQAEKSLAMCVLTAPRDGTIASIHAEPGELLDPTSAQSLLTMVGAEQLKVRAFVDEIDAMRIKPGMEASVVADGSPHERFRGRVQTCAPVMVPKKDFTNAPGERRDAKVREVVIALELMDSESPLVIGLPVEVCFEVSTSSTAGSRHDQGRTARQSPRLSTQR